MMMIDVDDAADDDDGDDDGDDYPCCWRLSLHMGFEHFGGKRRISDV